MQTGAGLPPDSLIAALGEQRDCNPIMLEKELGETRIAGQGDLGGPARRWPRR